MSQTTRLELIKRVSKREIPMLGGDYAKGCFFDLDGFTDRELKRTLESSRPIDSPIIRKKSYKGMLVLETMNQRFNVNTEKIDL